MLEVDRRQQLQQSERRRVLDSGEQEAVELLAAASIGLAEYTETPWLR